jgi:membrane-anchored glycerophosphoryl diester phosphodiesterase (GDPDase)
MNLAYLCFLFFWLQGLSLIHWFHEKGLLPTLGLILTYVMLPFLNVFMVMILAVAGYTDAWFNFRLRINN